MGNNFKKPSIELTEELAQAVEKAAESFDRPAKKVMGLKDFMRRILPTIEMLRAEKEATWSEVAEFLGEQIGHEYSENHVRAMYLSIVNKEASKKAPKKNIKKAPEKKAALTPSKTKKTSNPTTKPSAEPEQPVIPLDPPKTQREYRPPPDMIVQGTKDPFN